MSMTKIATVTVGAGGAASIDFTSISGSFTDLLLDFSIRSTQASVVAYAHLTLNGSSSNFSGRGLYGTGAAVGSFSSTPQWFGEVVGANATANTFSNTSIYFPNYSGATNKSYSIDSVGENNATLANQVIYAGLWSQTTAITSLSIVSTSGTFVQYSTATLYGITKGSLAGVTVS